MRPLLVLADDRTGALETAGMCADGTGSAVAVLPLRNASPTGLGQGPGQGLGQGLGLGQGVAVIDLQTRHLSAAEASARVRALTISAPCDAHKIDSLLRGNWAVELEARCRMSSKRVLLIPAFPALGRICRAGVVHVDGVPVGQGIGGNDVRVGVVSSRPADHLRAAGLTEIVALATPADVETWLSDQTGSARGAAVCDATTDAEIDAITTLWRRSASDAVIVAGTARVVASAAIANAGPLVGVTDTRPPRPSVHGPVLVVCASAHPIARRQVAAAQAEGAAVETLADPSRGTASRSRSALEQGRHLILVSEEPAGRNVPAAAARRVAEMLATATRDLLHSVPIGALVLIGGDTAAAVLGERELTVEGTIATGTPFLRREAGSPLIVTRAGGFGDTNSLVELLRSLTGGP